MNTVNPYDIVPGDAASRTKGVVTHWGVCVGHDLILDIVPGASPRLVSLWAFSDGQPVTVRRSPENQRPTILERAWHVQRSPRLYDAFNNNCQHLKNFILTGERHSETVQGIGAATAIASLLMLANRR